MKKLMIILSVFIVICNVSVLFSQPSGTNKKIGELQGSNLVITHPIEDIKQAIIQEIGDCDIITDVSLKTDNGYYYLTAFGFNNENSITYLASMYIYNNELYMATAAQNAVANTCKGDPCKLCEVTFTNGQIDNCNCSSSIGTCIKKASNSLAPNGLGYVERYLMY